MFVRVTYQAFLYPLILVFLIVIGVTPSGPGVMAAVEAPVILHNCCSTLIVLAVKKVDS